MRLSRFVSAAAALALGAVLAMTGAQPAAAAGTNYVALGDSYSSGVGAGSYISGSGDCKRSTKAYPYLWAASHSPSSFTFVACSGAVTSDVLNNQISAVNSSTGLVSISIGGNDAGFADVMTTCALSSEATCLARVDEARRFASEQLPGRLDQVYSAIRGKAPSARVVVLGYPRFYKLNGSCIVGLSETERAAINGAADHLNTITRGRASAAGFAFGDVSGPFTGHEICSGDAWLNSVTWPVDESYHPKAAGQSGGYLPVMTAAAG